MYNWANVLQSITDLWLPTIIVLGVGAAVITAINMNKKKQMAQK